MKRCQTENVCVLCLFKGNCRIIKHCFLSISLEWCWSPPGLCSGTCLVSPMSHYDHPAFWSFSPSTTVERNVWKSVLSRAPSSSRFTFSKGFWSAGWWGQWPYTTWWKVKTSNIIIIWWKRDQQTLPPTEESCWTCATAEPPCIITSKHIAFFKKMILTLSACDF